MAVPEKDDGTMPHTLDALILKSHRALLGALFPLLYFSAVTVRGSVPDGHDVNAERDQCLGPGNQGAHATESITDPRHDARKHSALD